MINNMIQQCKAGHSYLAGGTLCPWCEIESLRAELAAAKDQLAANVISKALFDELKSERDALRDNNHVLRMRAEDAENAFGCAKADPNALRIAFVQGAAWWEYHQTKATMWPSDRQLAEEEASRRQQNGKLGVLPDAMEDK